MLKYFLSLGVLHLSLLYRTLESNLKIIFHVRNNNFSYTQLSHPFFSSSFFLLVSGHFSSFFLFFFRMVLISFTCFCLKLFFVFLIIFIHHFYIYPKIFIKKSYLLYYFQFSSSEFSPSKSKEISISSIRYLGIFFSLTTYLNYYSGNTWG